MAALTFGHRKSRLPIVTFTAVFVLVKIVHLHARAALPVPEKRRMAAVASEHRGMQLMAEDRGRHVPSGIGEILLYRGEVMAFCTIPGREGYSAVMAAAAVFSLPHFLHRDVRRSFLHLEDFRVAFAATKSFLMIAMGISDRKPAGLVRKDRQIMAAAARVFVQRHFFMRHYDVTLIAMYPEAEMHGVREFALRIERKLLIGMARETRQTRVLQ
jgi:hypothetical protein